MEEERRRDVISDTTLTCSVKSATQKTGYAIKPAPLISLEYLIKQ